MLVTNRYCFGTESVLCWYRIGTELIYQDIGILNGYCAGTMLVLFWYYVGTVLVLCSYCVRSVLVLGW